MLRINKISDITALEKHKDVWERLFLDSRVDNIFLSYDWIMTLLRNFKSVASIEILIALDERGDSVGIAPFMIKKDQYLGMGVRKLCFIGSSISDRLDFMVKPSYAEEAISSFMDYVMKSSHKWDYIDLEEMADYTGNYRLVEKWIESKNIMKIKGPGKKTYFVDFSADEGETRKTFGKKLKRRIKKIKNRNHPFEFMFKRYGSGDMDKEGLFRRMESIENRSWKGEKKSGIFSKKESGNFHREILDIFSPVSQIDLSLLEIDSKPAAYVYNYYYKGRIYNYSIAYDRSFSHVSPGTLLMLWTLSDDSRQKIREFDFSRGEGTWKSRLTDSYRIHDRIRIFRKHPYGVFLCFLQGYFMPNMRKCELLYRLWMKLKERLGWL